MTSRPRCASTRRDCGADPTNLVLCILVEGWNWELSLCRACTLDYLQQRGTLRVRGLIDRNYRSLRIGRT